MDENESLDHAAARELEEETSVKPSDVVLEQVGIYLWQSMSSLENGMYMQHTVYACITAGIVTSLSLTLPNPSLSC